MFRDIFFSAKLHSKNWTSQFCEYIEFFFYFLIKILNSIEIIFFKMGQSFSANKETNQNQEQSQSNEMPKSHGIASSAMNNSHNQKDDIISANHKDLFYQNHSQSNILPKSHDIASSAMENTHNIIGDTIILQSNSQHEINQHAINQHPI